MFLNGILCERVIYAAFSPAVTMHDSATRRYDAKFSGQNGFNRILYTFEDYFIFLLLLSFFSVGKLHDLTATDLTNLDGLGATYCLSRWTQLQLLVKLFELSQDK